MKQKLRYIFFITLYYLGIGYIIKSYNNKKNRIPILLFHRISDIKDNFWEPLPVKYFDKLIKFISKHYDIITIDYLLENKSKNLKNKCIITFDDGYKDFLENAYPILQKYNIKSTLFVTVNPVNTNSLIWTSELNKAIENTTKNTLELTFNNKLNKYNISNTLQKQKVVFNLLQILKNISNKEQNKIISQIKTKLNYTKPDNINFLNWNDINKLKTQVNIQSHSLTHSFMTTLTDNELDEELIMSKKILSDKTNTNIKYFSYPIGDYNNNVIEKTKKYYTSAFIVSDNLVEVNKLSNNNYKYKIPRINITDKSVYEVFFRINGFHTFVKKIK